MSLMAAIVAKRWPECIDTGATDAPVLDCETGATDAPVLNCETGAADGVGPVQIATATGAAGAARSSTTKRDERKTQGCGDASAIEKGRAAVEEFYRVFDPPEPRTEPHISAATTAVAKYGEPLVLAAIAAKRESFGVDIRESARGKIGKVANFFTVNMPYWIARTPGALANDKQRRSDADREKRRLVEEARKQADNQKPRLNPREIANAIAPSRAARAAVDQKPREIAEAEAAA